MSDRRAPAEDIESDAAGVAREPIRLADLDILRDRVRFPACRRWVARLYLLASWALACAQCARTPADVNEGTP